ncbi:MAG: Asp-tRNA(Asn)/Glu-tRNA(Gln) amidotransferase subunit GatC [Chitinispirillaceae bacterium]|nr:Asp-tRNA(Asn)/Glu-tRNA(Gln) amidotransferase subunit GatC [Chitinispirillaceae bacterium]
MIDREQVLHVARLARLNLTGEEVEQFSRSLGSILEYFEQIRHAPTEGVDATNVMARRHDALRNDIPVPSLKRDEILQNGPQIRENHFAVPKVIDG